MRVRMGVFVLMTALPVVAAAFGRPSLLRSDVLGPYALPVTVTVIAERSSRLPEARSFERFAAKRHSVSSIPPSWASSPIERRG